MSTQLLQKLMRVVLSALLVAALVGSGRLGGEGAGLVLSPFIFVAAYLWLGVVFFFIEMVWKLATKPEERLFASIMLGGTVFVTAAILAAYWLIADSLGFTATVFYAIGAYVVFSIVMWFRRHTANYYLALQRQKAQDKSAQEQVVTEAD